MNNMKTSRPPSRNSVCGDQLKDTISAELPKSSASMKITTSRAVLGKSGRPLTVLRVFDLPLHPLRQVGVQARVVDEIEMSPMEVGFAVSNTGGQLDSVSQNASGSKVQSEECVIRSAGFSNQKVHSEIILDAEISKLTPEEASAEINDERSETAVDPVEDESDAASDRTVEISPEFRKKLKERAIAAKAAGRTPMPSSESSSSPASSPGRGRSPTSSPSSVAYSLRTRIRAKTPTRTSLPPKLKDQAEDDDEGTPAFYKKHHWKKILLQGYLRSAFKDGAQRAARETARRKSLQTSKPRARKSKVSKPPKLVREDPIKTSLKVEPSSPIAKKNIKVEPSSPRAKKNIKVEPPSSSTPRHITRSISAKNNGATDEDKKKIGKDHHHAAATTATAESSGKRKMIFLHDPPPMMMNNRKRQQQQQGQSAYTKKQ